MKHWNSWNRVSLFWDFGDRRYSSWTVDGSGGAGSKAFRKGSLSLTLVPVFFWHPDYAPVSPIYTLHQQVIREIGQSFWVRFLTSMNSSSSWVWLSITHGYEATGATTMLERWVGSDHFELVVWLQSHHYKYKPLRKGIQGSKTLDLFVLLSKNARKNYQRFCLKEKSW